MIWLSRCIYFLYVLYCCSLCLPINYFLMPVGWLPRSYPSVSSLLSLLRRHLHMLYIFTSEAKDVWSVFMIEIHFQNRLVPVFDSPIPAARRHSAGLDGMPLATNGDLIMALDCFEQLASLPIPEPRAT